MWGYTHIHTSKSVMERHTSIFKTGRHTSEFKMEKRATIFIYGDIFQNLK